MPHEEHHRIHRSGWLRAAVLGANDGVVSTSSLLLGVSAAHGSHGSIVIAGIAGLAAGAMAMAAGEYVSVSSQADTERADLAQEQHGIDTDRDEEHRELASIYVGRGLTPNLAQEVATQLMAHDALGAHARDELGISETLRARPLQAALASGTSFASGAILPVLTALAVTGTNPGIYIAGVSLVILAGLGAIAAQIGGASIVRGAARVLFWGALAMAVTASVGALLGAAA
jgi:vacuolar iron transporter family protein